MCLGRVFCQPFGMGRLLRWSCVALVAMGCAGAPARVASSEPLHRSGSRRGIVRDVLAHTVKIEVYDGKEVVRTASGVVVGSELTSRGSQTFVVSSGHVFDAEELKAPRVAVLAEVEGESVELSAEPIALGATAEMDLALIRVRGVKLVPAQLAEDEELEPGESVVVAAAPFGRNISLSGGMVSRVDLDPQTRLPQMLKTDAAIGYGASGGGVFSLETGRLMAVVEGYRTAKVGFEVADHSYSFDVPMPGETFAAPSTKVRAFLAANGLSRLLPAATARNP